ncbi:hypothetical protein [Modestobacter marinus]|uniref:hypothetical protein n=1 Tax=Modestobacter marinus TaxID=477641 RepID=UPI001C939450|nr:hypothetical protein [Modestobacter marinus]
MKHLPLVVGTALAVALGVFAVVYGESDDSPGLQGLGALLVLGAIAYAVRALRRGRSQGTPPGARR